jgi:hypothetical protein
VQATQEILPQILVRRAGYTSHESGIFDSDRDLTERVKEGLGLEIPGIGHRIEPGVLRDPGEHRRESQAEGVAGTEFDHRGPSGFEARIDE